MVGQEFAHIQALVHIEDVPGHNQWVGHTKQEVHMGLGVDSSHMGMEEWLVVLVVPQLEQCSV